MHWKNLRFTFVLLGLFIVGCQNEDKNPSAFVFDTQEVDALKQIPAPSHPLTHQELTDINAAAYQSIKKSKRLSELDLLLIYPYLANAQKEFAFLSQKISGAFLGSFYPVTLGVIQLFDNETSLSAFDDSIDPYSNAVASLVVSKAKARLDADRLQIHDYPIERGADLWYATNGYVGLNFGNVIPWQLENCSEFRCPSPPKPSELEKQALQVKLIMKTLDNSKRKMIGFWASNGEWEEIAENYMRQEKTPLDKRLQVRSVLLSTTTDAKCAAFDSKYTYWLQRPNMFDSSIKPLITVPSHPSYPSGHSTVGKAAAVVLTAYFPEATERWDSLAEEAGMSRIWAGIHYPIDHEEGKKLGEKVAQRALH